MRIRTCFIVAAALVLPTVALGAPPNNSKLNTKFSNSNPNMGTVRHGGFPPGKGGLLHPRGRYYKGHWYAYGAGPCWKEADGRFHWIC